MNLGEFIKKNYWLVAAGLGMALGVGTAYFNNHGYQGRCSEVVKPIREEYQRVCREERGLPSQEENLETVLKDRDWALGRNSCPLGCEEWSCFNGEAYFKPVASCE